MCKDNSVTYSFLFADHTKKESKQAQPDARKMAKKILCWLLIAVQESLFVVTGSTYIQKKA
jgi:hypothetical protein